MVKIVRHTRFKLDPFGDGGSKRSVQIQELLEKSGMEFVNENFGLPKGLHLSQRVKLFVKGLSYVFCSFSLKEIRNLRNMVSMAKYFGLRIPGIVEKYSQKDVLFVNENTVSGAYGLPYLMKLAGKKVVTLPHNLESFCGGKDVQSGKEAPYWLYEDIERLKLSDCVFCISKEETWLLRLFDVNAEYLPYYPPKAVEEYLLSVRSKRASCEPVESKNCLILGSATNYPTKKGMEDLLSWFANYEVLPFDLHIAGYGTDRLIEIQHPQFHYHGSVNKNVLESLLIESDCMIINQPATSGALTRIVETLIAGLPIFANLNAARDYFGTKGVNVFQSFEELMDLLENLTLPRCVSVPKRNEASEKLFVDMIKHLCI